ncbi:MAG: OmpA family protein [Candidatus Melainabacteria bacterium]|nr:OmpA family protein [Candidatus Melainabacteria bacterium]
MKYHIAITCLVSLLLAGCAPSAEVNPDTASGFESRDDLLSIRQGAVLLSASSQWDNTSESAFQLFDDCAYTNWSSAGDKASNNVFDVELQNPCRLTDMLIDNEHGRASAFPGLLAKTVRVLASDSSPVSGYEQLAEVVLNKASSKRITFDKKSGGHPYKWLRFIVVDNWGEKDATQLYEIQAYGTRVVDPVDNNSPSFKGGVFSGTWWPLKFATEGNVLFGCACKPEKNDEGMLGSIQENQARVFFPLAGKPGVAILTQSTNGEVVNISRYYQFSLGDTTSNLFALQRREKSPSCNQEPIKSVESLIWNYLERYHKAILYGIDFKPDSAELTPESDSTLNAVASVMKNHPNLRLSVEAHNGWTDSSPIKNIALDFHDDSIDSHKKLSEARAKTVVNWLCNHKVESSQLQAKGWGKDKPIWVDGIETPRQSLILNRRIELIVINESKKIEGRFGDF